MGRSDETSGLSDSGQEPQGAGTGWRNELSGEVRGSAIQAHVVHGDVYLGAAPRAPVPVPRQLPPPPAHFTGRASEIGRAHV